MRKVFLAFIKVILLLIVFSNVNCKADKHGNLIKSGKVVQNNFLVEIPFESPFGLIIIPVEIEGKSYKFLFDTGSINIVSPIVAQKLGMQTITENTTIDSGGAKQVLNYSKIPKISIAGIEFVDTAAAIVPLDGLICVPIDGVIGSNLMQNAVWKIDYKNKKIVFTSSLEKFSLSDYDEKIPFSTNKQSAPLFQIDFGKNNKEIITLDSGSNGGIHLDLSVLNTIPKDSILGVVKKTGSATQGLFAKDTSNIKSGEYARITNLRIGSLNLNNQFVSFSDNTVIGSLGNNFLKEYEIILDWKNENIFLKKAGIKEEKRSYGFSWSYNDGLASVSEINYPSKAGELLKLGDHIIKFNNKDFRNLNVENWCAFLKEKKPDSISIVIQRGQVLTNYYFKKKELLTLD